jgi:hypothetical protein
MHISTKIILIIFFALQVQRFATSLLDHARTSYELEIMLNYDLEGEIWDPGETQEWIMNLHFGRNLQKKTWTSIYPRVKDHM